MFGHVGAQGAEINFSYVMLCALIDLANFVALLFGAGKVLYNVFMELFFSESSQNNELKHA